nr:hypothetical protein [Tanacetum cinerariifolium]
MLGFFAGKCGLRSWEWCGGGGVEGKRGEWGSGELAGKPKVEPSSRSKAIEDIISIGSFVEALVLNHYVLIRKILRINLLCEAIKPQPMQGKLSKEVGGELSKEEQAIQQLQMQANILKQNSMNKFTALKTTTQHLERKNFTYCPLFQRALSHLFYTDVITFKYELSQNMNNLEKELNNEILHEKDSKSALSVIKVQFARFIYLKMLKSSNYDSDAQEARHDFKDYTQIKAQSFKDLIIQRMKSINQCIVERERHEKEIQNRLKRLNDRKLQIQECMVQKVKASDASLGEKYCSRIVSDKQHESINNTCVVEKVDRNVIPDSPDMCDNEIQTDQNAEDERAALANLIVNLTLDTEENKDFEAINESKRIIDSRIEGMKIQS